MFSLYQQVDTKLVVLGWYATSTNINYVSTLVNNVLTEKFGCMNPILVTVDPTLANNRLTIAAYTSTVVCVDGKPFHARFDRVNLETKPSEAEKIALDTIIHATDDSDDSLDAPSLLPKDSDALNASMSKFTEQLDTIGAYLSSVIDGRIQGDAVAGREIAAAIASIPSLDKATFEKMFSSNLSDMLLIAHLATIARTQVALADRLNSASNQ
jgi:translation initiation factor 3 subunit F